MATPKTSAGSPFELGAAAGSCSPDATRGPPLNCLRGLSGPPELREDLRQLLALPAPVRERFWEILARCLDSDPNDEEQQAIVAICREHGADPQLLALPVRGGRFLILNAARAALTKEAFVEDLARLLDDAALPDGIACLGTCYDRAVPVLRSAIIARTIADHGKLTDDVNWRVDKIINSEHGDGVNVPVAVLTFRYREGDRTERITLHLLPDQLNKLKDACLQMLPEKSS